MSIQKLLKRRAEAELLLRQISNNIQHCTKASPSSSGFVFRHGHSDFIHVPKDSLYHFKMLELLKGMEAEYTADMNAIQVKLDAVNELLGEG
jgi:hypothetical protein